MWSPTNENLLDDLSNKQELHSAKYITSDVRNGQVAPGWQSAGYMACKQEEQVLYAVVTRNRRTAFSNCIHFSHFTQHQ
jgi:hypothetical protein